MAVAYIGTERGKKELVRKDVVDRIVRERMKRHTHKLEDALKLANRWGAKAAEIEKEKLRAEEKIRKMWIVIGGLVGNQILLTIIWCLSHNP